MLRDNLLFVLDALDATGPMVKLIKKALSSFVIVITEGYVLVQAAHLAKQNKLHTRTSSNGKIKKVIQYANSLILNGQHQDTLVNYVAYQEIDIRTQKVLYSCTWITDIFIRLVCK